MTKEIEIKLYELGPTRSARVRWILLEADLEFESFQDGVSIFQSEDLLDIHPLGKLPAALINGKPLFESAAIVTAIADLVPEKKLIAEPNTWERHLHNQWVCFALSEMEPFVQSTEVNTSNYILPASQHIKEIISQNNYFYTKAASAIEKHLSAHEFMINEQFSATDIIVAYTLCWGQEQNLLSDYPNINNYMDKMYSRKHCTFPKPFK